MSPLSLIAGTEIFPLCSVPTGSFPDGLCQPSACRPIQPFPLKAEPLQRVPWALQQVLLWSQDGSWKMGLCIRIPLWGAGQEPGVQVGIVQAAC